MTALDPHRPAIARALAAACLLFVAAAVDAAPGQYLGDGAVQNDRGGWDLPLQGSCPADPTQETRPDCIALRFPSLTSSATCVAPNYSWTSSYCNDLVNSASQGACEAHPDRKWSNGVCAIVLRDDDRNNVTCALHGGTWGTTSACTGNWVMPMGDQYDPKVLTWNGTSAPGPGDQCLRCHNDVTQYNGPRDRDTEETLFMGHKNMSRKVTAGLAWGGPDFSCTGAFGADEDDCVANGGTWDPAIYPGTDSGQDFDWDAGTVTVDGTPRPLYWIFGDWLSAYPRAIYHADPDTSTNPDKPGVAYSCARCHTTGWTSDATINYGAGNSSANATREPERSFPGITWDGVTDATAGQVNLAGNVTGDSNKMASWDEFGITCSRCHSAAVNRTTTAEYGFSAVTGMSSHHNVMTAPDAGSGYCSDPRFTAQAQCDGAGAAWLTACSVAGVCSNPAYTTSGKCVGGGGTWTRYDAQGTCTTAGGTWATSSCDVAGVCNRGTCSNPTYANQDECVGDGAVWTGYPESTCATNGGTWYAASDVIRCEDAGGRWTGNKSQRGQIITGLCMSCHRQESGGWPNGTTVTPGNPPIPNYAATDPAGQIKVGPTHGTVDYAAHPQGNQFLNSPHAKFTGSYDKIELGRFKSNMTGEYKSWFMADAETAGTGNGCTGCHEVHTSTVAGERPFRAECTECHEKSLPAMLHPAGKGTPLEHMGTEPFESCVTCHMPGGEHLFRINPDAAYATFPASALAGTVNAATAPDGSYASAVWVDVDRACGQCHGGGASYVETTGTITAGSTTLAVASGSGLAVGQRIRIAGAGAPYYDEDGVSKHHDDFETFVAGVAGNNVTLAGKATKSVAGAEVIQNPTGNGAGWIGKANLAAYAKGIHNDAPKVSFTYTLNGAQTLTALFNAGATTCSGSSSACDVYAWDFGDGATGSGKTPSHTYAAPGSYTVVLTVTQYGTGTGSKSKIVTTYAPDLPPTAEGVCTFDADDWSLSVDDDSSDDHGIKQVAITWGDGSRTTTGAGGAVFNHVYTKAGTFTVTVKAADTKGQIDTYVCAPAPVAAYFQVTGEVVQSNGTTPLSNAKVQLFKDGTTLVKTVYTNIAGAFVAGGLKPGSYTPVVTRTGYSFPAVAPVVVGPSATIPDVVALP